MTGKFVFSFIFLMLSMPLTASGLFSRSGRFSAVRLTGHERPVFGLAFVRSPYLIVSGCKGGVLNYWNSRGLLLSRKRLTSSVYKFCGSNDGSNFFVARGDGRIDLLSGRRRLKSLVAHKTNLISVAANPDGISFVTTSEDRTIKLWKNSGKLLMTIKDHKQAVTTAGYHPGRMLFATGGRDNLIKVFHRNGFLFKTLKGHRDYVWCVRFSPNGKYLVSASRDRTIRIWSTKTWKMVRLLKGHSAAVWALAISRDSRFIISGGRGGRLHVWSARTGRLIRRLSGHRRGVVTLVLNRRGNVLASGSLDGTVILWRGL